MTAAAVMDEVKRLLGTMVANEWGLWRNTSGDDPANNIKYVNQVLVYKCLHQIRIWFL